jgi:hypothetical protein
VQANAQIVNLPAAFILALSAIGLRCQVESERKIGIRAQHLHSIFFQIVLDAAGRS